MKKIISKKNFKFVILLITIICLVVAVWILKSNIKFQWTTLNIFLGGGALAFAFVKFPQVRKIVGEDGTPGPSSFIRFVITLLFLFLPIAIYVIINQTKFPSSVAQLSILVLAPIMATLAIAARKLVNGRQGQTELIRAGKKFIVTTGLFTVFVVYYFIMNLSTDGIDTNTIDFSVLGFYRWLFFWLSTFSLSTGIFLFSLALIDLIWALRDSDTTLDKAN